MRSLRGALLQAEQSQHSKIFLLCQILQFLSHLCCPSPDSLDCVHISVVLESPALNAALQLCPMGTQLRGRITSLGLLLVLDFAVLGSFFWSTSTVSRSFSAKLNSSQLNLTCAGRWSYSSSSAGHHVSCCSMLWDSRVPISLPCWGRSLYAFWPFSA